MNQVCMMIRTLLTLAVATSLLAGCTGTVEFPYADRNQPLPEGDAGDQDAPDEGEAPDQGDVPGDVTPDAPDEGDVPAPDQGEDVPVEDVPVEDVPVVEGALDPEGMQQIALVAMNQKTCTDATCHGPNSVGNTFSLVPSPQTPEDIAADLEAFTNVVDFGAPGNSQLLMRGRDLHRGVALDDTQYCAIFGWIDAGDGAADQVCTPP
jgi:hypothetical protein